jgi:hypothetical protein
VSGVGGEEGGSNIIESQWRSQWRGGRQGRRHVTGRWIIADDDCGAPCYWWGLSGGPWQPPDIEVEEVGWRCGGAARRQGHRLGYRRQTGGGLPGGGGGGCRGRRRDGRVTDHRGRAVGSRTR